MYKSRMMFIRLMALSLFSCGLIARGGVVFDFEDQTQFQSDFPTNSMSLTGNSTASLLSDPGRLYLVATNSADAGSRSAVYSASTYNSELDFFSASKTIAFNSLKMETYASGTTFVSYFGITSMSGSNVAASDNGVFFILTRNGTTLSLVQRISDSNVELDSWAVTFDESANGRAVEFSSLALTLDGSSWSVDGVMTGLSGDTPITGSGAFTADLTEANWGSEFYLGMQAQQSASDAARWTTLTVDSVAVPEPTSISLVLVSCAGLFILRRAVR